jgi:hypothetical protein
LFAVSSAWANTFAFFCSNSGNKYTPPSAKLLAGENNITLPMAFLEKTCSATYCWLQLRVYSTINDLFLGDVWRNILTPPSEYLLIRYLLKNILTPPSVRLSSLLPMEILLPTFKEVLYCLMPILFRKKLIRTLKTSVFYNFFYSANILLPYSMVAS